MKSLARGDIGFCICVLLGLWIVVFLLFQLPNSTLPSARGGGFTVRASFDNVAGLEAGSPVTIGGVAVGRVEDVRFDVHLKRAVATLRIKSTYDQIPIDSEASIETQGVLGSEMVAILPGGSDKSLREGSQIDDTHSALIIESVVNRVFSKITADATK